jgi:hypothetical protein
VTHLAVKDDLLDAQTLRTVGVAPYGGADVGECVATAARVNGTDLTSWHDAWTSTAPPRWRWPSARLPPGARRARGWRSGGLRAITARPA